MIGIHQKVLSRLFFFAEGRVWLITAVTKNDFQGAFEHPTSQNSVAQNIMLCDAVTANGREHE